MSSRTLDAVVRDGLSEVLGGIGSAAPGPLFVVDHLGRARALNGLARSMDASASTAEAFISPIQLGARQLGRVVGYVMAETPGGSAMVAAMVALAAGVLSRGCRERDAGGASVARVGTDEPLEDARARLASVLDESAVGEVVAAAAREALGARTAVVHVRSESGRSLVPTAADGVELKRLRKSPLGHGLLGWAAQRAEPTCLSSWHRLPPSAPRHDGERCAVEGWLELPAIVVPLLSGTQLLGLLTVSGLPRVGGIAALREAARRLEPLADRASASLAGARMVRQVRRQERVAREVEIARQIQASLLPRGRQCFPGLDVAGECRPAAQVGGDYFGFRGGEPGELTLTMFDVAGHGIGAAFCMTLIRSALHGELMRGGDPGEVLTRANGLVWEDVASSGLFATAFLARFDRKAGELAYANAGHCKPIHWSATERAFLEHGRGGLPLGLLPDSVHREARAPFGERDVFVTYTDGIVEAANTRGEEFGRARLLGLVHRYRRRSAQALLRGIWRELEQFRGGAPLPDDATLAIVRCGRDAGSAVRAAAARGRNAACEATPRPSRAVAASSPVLKVDRSQS